VTCNQQMFLILVIKSSRMIWAVHVARLVDKNFGGETRRKGTAWKT
jgi:hypothetical protein